MHLLESLSLMYFHFRLHSFCSPSPPMARMSISLIKTCQRWTWRTQYGFTTLLLLGPVTTARNRTSSNWRRQTGGSSSCRPRKHHASLSAAVTPLSRCTRMGICQIAFILSFDLFDFPFECMCVGVKRRWCHGFSGLIWWRLFSRLLLFPPPSAPWRNSADLCCLHPPLDSHRCTNTAGNSSSIIL